MANENNEHIENNEENSLEQDYIDQIAQLKQNTVSKTEYEKLRADHKKALDALVNGGQLTPEETEKPVDKDALRKELFNEGCSLSNLEYWQKTLQLRKAIIDEGGTDPFLPYGSKIAPTVEDVEKANTVAEVVQECIDYADGDSRIFTNELDRRTIDAMPFAGRKPRR